MIFHSFLYVYQRLSFPHRDCARSVRKARSVRSVQDFVEQLSVEYDVEMTLGVNEGSIIVTWNDL